MQKLVKYEYVQLSYPPNICKVLNFLHFCLNIVKLNWAFVLRGKGIHVSERCGDALVYTIIFERAERDHW